MAPEQAGRAAQATTAADVYGLGGLLYWLLTGRPPHKAETAVDTLRQVCDAAVVPPRAVNPAVDRELEEVALKCLAKDPADRYPTAGAVADDLGRWAAGQPTAARPPSVAEQVWRWVRANVGTAARVAAVGLARGLLAAVPLAAQMFGGICRQVADTYRAFPSREVPWLIRGPAAVEPLTADRSPGHPLVVAFVVAAAAACAVGLGGMGWAAVRAVGSRDRWGDGLAGLGVGVPAGLVCYLTMAPAVLLAAVVGPQIGTLYPLAAAAFPDGRAEPSPWPRFADDPTWPPCRPTSGP